MKLSTMNWSIIHCAALLVAGALLAAAPLSDASAQTATNLDCKGCVGKKDLGKKAVTARAIKKNTIKAKAIKDGAVEESKLADSAVTVEKLHDAAKPSGAAYTSLDSSGIDLLGADKTIASVDLLAPADGLVVVLAQGFLEFGAQELVGCSLGTDEAFDVASSVQVTGDNASPNSRKSISTSRVFTATKGPGTYNLVCLTDGGSGVQIRNVKLTALFVPQEY